MKFSLYLTAFGLAATSLALPAWEPLDQNVTALDAAAAKRDNILGTGVNVMYSPDGVLKVFGVLKFSGQAIYDSFTAVTVGDGTVADQIAKNVYNHCLQYIANSGPALGPFYWITQAADQWIGACDKASNAVPFTVGLVMDIRDDWKTYDITADQWRQFVDLVVKYFQDSGVTVITKVADDITNIGPQWSAPAPSTRKRLMAKPRDAQDQVCATPIDIRQYFVNSTPDPPTHTAQC